MLDKNQQFSFSHGLTISSLPILSIDAYCDFPLIYASRVGRHSLAELPQVTIQGKVQHFSPVNIVGLLLEELVAELTEALDASSLLEKWIQSREALQQFLTHRQDHFDDLVKLEQSFVETEQALILGHSMHPAPKSRTGFVHEDWQKFSLELRGQTQLHFWLVHQELATEILLTFPDLQEKAFAVGPKDFVGERFSYYCFGNTLFGLINAIGATGYVSEDILLARLHDVLAQLFEQYPESTLLQGLLFKPTLAYKGNLLTCLHELDELIAPVENQSVDWLAVQAF